MADIHFDYRLALAAIDAGIDALRINPGNIGSEGRIRKVLSAAKERGIPIRIGINGGSLEKRSFWQSMDRLPKLWWKVPSDKWRFLNALGLRIIKISVKTSSIPNTVAAYELLAKKVECPLHIGVTEAGTLLKGSIKSSLGLGILLFHGIGDTMRVSLTGIPSTK